MTGPEIRALARLLDKVDYYRLLRVECDTTLPKIRAAYHTARREFHPDAYLSEPEDLRQAVDRIARRITEAYLVLRDQNRRSAYDSALEQGEKRFSAETQDAARQQEYAARGLTTNGRRFFTLAEQEERDGNPQAALNHLRMALTFEPKNEVFRQRLDALKAKREN